MCRLCASECSFRTNVVFFHLPADGGSWKIGADATHSLFTLCIIRSALLVFSFLEITEGP